MSELDPGATRTVTQLQHIALRKRQTRSRLKQNQAVGETPLVPPPPPIFEPAQSLLKLSPAPFQNFLRV